MDSAIPSTNRAGTSPTSMCPGILGNPVEMHLRFRAKRGPDILHFLQVPWWPCCWSWDCTLSSKALEQWLWKFSCNQNHLESSLKHRLLGPRLESLLQQVWGGAKTALLASSQVILSLVLHGRRALLSNMNHGKGPPAACNLSSPQKSGEQKRQRIWWHWA